MKLVFDASTLILLAKIDLLREVANEKTIIVPEKVRKECLAKNTGDAMLISNLVKENKIHVEGSGQAGIMRKIQSDFKIGDGEAEALWLARRLDCPLAVDDGPTLKACKIIGLKFVTAIHFLLDLAARNVLDRETAMAKLEKLSLYGRYKKKILENAAGQLKGEDR